MQKRERTFGSWRGGGRVWASAALFGLAMAFSGGGVGLAHEAHGHPARIHDGTCENLGPVAFQLNGVGGSVDVNDTPVATPTAINPETAYQVMVSETAIDTPLDALLTGEHAVMVYESDEDMRGIVCGNMGGAMSGDRLITGLAEMNEPGHIGFAIFTPHGERTDVLLIMGHAMAPVSAATGIAGEDEEAGHDEEESHGATATPAA